MMIVSVADFVKGQEAIKEKECYRGMLQAQWRTTRDLRGQFQSLKDELEGKKSRCRELEKKINDMELTMRAASRLLDG